jgi:hypothetical protein
MVVDIIIIGINIIGRMVKEENIDIIDGNNIMENIMENIMGKKGKDGGKGIEEVDVMEGIIKDNGVK